MAKRSDSKETRKRRTYERAAYLSGEIRPAFKPEPPESGGGIFSLALELLGAVAVSLMQRSFKIWRAELLVTLNNPEPRSSQALSSRTALKDLTDLSEHRFDVYSG